MIKRGLNKTLAEVGKIKTGMKGAVVESRGGKKFGLPRKLDHFIVTTTERGQDGNYVENGTIMEKLGNDPRELKIRLPFDSIDKNFFTQFQAYSGGKKLCAGDGIKAARRGEITVKDANTDHASLEVKGEEVHEVPCDFETCPIAQAGKCKVSGILSCFLPDSGDLGGVYKFRTHSWNAVSSILGALEFFASQTGGILMGMPLKLILLKKATEDHGPVMYATVVLDGEEILGLRKLAIEERDSRKQVLLDMPKFEAAAAASGILEDRDDEAEVEAEFYTEGEEDGRPPKGTSAESLEAQLAAKTASQGNDHTGAPTSSGTGNPNTGTPTTAAPQKPAAAPAQARAPAAPPKPAAPPRAQPGDDAKPAENQETTDAEEPGLGLEVPPQPRAQSAPEAPGKASGTPKRPGAAAPKPAASKPAAQAPEKPAAQQARRFLGDASCPSCKGKFKKGEFNEATGVCPTCGAQLTDEGIF